MTAFAALLACALPQQPPAAGVLTPAGDGGTPHGVAVAMVGVMRALLSAPITSSYQQRVIAPLAAAGHVTDTFIVVVSNVTCASSVLSCRRDDMDNELTSDHAEEVRAAVARAYAPTAFELLPARPWTEDLNPACAPWNAASAADDETKRQNGSGEVGWQELSTRILQQWATIRHAYRLIEQTERRRGAAYAWVIKTRTDVAFFEDLGAIVARSAPDRVHVPRNGMTESLDSRCHNDHLFWCPRHLCRPYFELLEIFESPFCRGATRYAAFNETLWASAAAPPSVFARGRGGVALVANGAHGPPNSSYWLPWSAQSGIYDVEYWFAARYSRGQRCTDFDSDQTRGGLSGRCCGLIDDSATLAYAVARYGSTTGRPVGLTCEDNMLNWRPHDASWPAHPAQQPSFVECLDGSAAWLASATNHLGEPVAHEDATASKELGSGNIEWRDAAGELVRVGGGPLPVPLATTHTLSAARWRKLSEVYGNDVPQPCAAIRPSATAAGEISAYTWSRYLESVYGEPLGDASVVEAHLASANFFYYAFYPMPECVVEWQYGDTLAPNVAWRAASILTPSRHASPPDGASFLRADGTDGLLGCMPNCPESVVGRVGFFVNRETEPSMLLRDSRNAMGGSSRRLEVMHVAFRANTNSDGTSNDFETGASWFYLAKGSGVFLDLEALGVHGRLLQSNRRALGMTGEAGWVDTDMDAYLARHNISVLLLEHEATCSMSAKDPRSASTEGMCAQPWYVGEVVVRRQPQWARRPETSGCTLPDALLSTGLTTAAPCACDDTLAYLNCQAGSRPSTLLAPPRLAPILDARAFVATASWELGDGWAEEYKMSPLRRAAMETEPF